MSQNDYYIFNTFHLFLFYFINETARTIVYAVFKNFYQIFITLLIMIFLIYSFSIWLMLEFPNAWSDGSMDIDCDQLYNCFLYTWDQGLRFGGGIGEHFQTTGPDSSQFYQRIFYSLIFFLVVNIIILNVFFGIIVDNFSQLRQEQQLKGIFSD